MSIPLFLKNMKNNTLLLLLFVVLMSIYLAVIIYMYDPNGIGALGGHVVHFAGYFGQCLGLWYDCQWSHGIYCQHVLWLSDLSFSDGLLHYSGQSTGGKMGL